MMRNLRKPRVSKGEEQESKSDEGTVKISKWERDR